MVLRRKIVMAHSVASGRFSGAFILCLALAGCGGGGGDEAPGLLTGRITVFAPNNRTDTSVRLQGTAFPPRGSRCWLEGGDRFFGIPPSCVCEPGTQATGQWTNSATRASGSLQLSMYPNEGCGSGTVFWQSNVIALAPGDNVISLSISDGVTQAAATISVIGR